MGPAERSRCLDGLWEWSAPLAELFGYPPDAAAPSCDVIAAQVEGDNLGALNLCARRPRAFDDESEQVGLLFASHAAVAFAHAQHIDQLNRAVDTPDLIGQAKGILMERYSISTQQAFQVLTGVSQNSNQKLLAVATEVTTTRRLTGLP